MTGNRSTRRIASRAFAGAALTIALAASAIAQTAPGATPAPVAPPAATNAAPSTSAPALPTQLPSTLQPSLAPSTTQTPAAATPSPAEPTAAPNATAAPTSPAPAEAAAPAPTTPSVLPHVDAALPRDLSPWGMFMQADIIVKLVMIGLAFASVLTWTIWLVKVLELLAARRRLKASLAILTSARSLADCRARLKPGHAAAPLVRAAETELQLSADAIEPAGVKERLASRLSQLQTSATRRINRGTGLLATIGATAPFVGLFGTVWGIMNSFIGISKSQTTNLAVVAPGIAEALLATALGLVAAIPAVVLYNMFSRWIAGYRVLYAEASNEVERLVSRDLDRATQGSHALHVRGMAAE
ncbi:MAG: tonB-system energizer ExbB [Rhizobiales bacterium]|nr:tonB-system energizer ExbB [Hyphomicrobiales bacterium]